MSVKKRKADPSIDASFLISPTISCEDYKAIEFDPKNPRAIPLPDGPFGDNKYVVVSDGGKKVTFDMQSGSVLKEVNGTFPEALIQFAKCILEEKNQGTLRCRETSTAITNLDQALQWLASRQADRKARGVQGGYTS